MTTKTGESELRKAIADRLISRKWNPEHPDFAKEIDELVAIYAQERKRLLGEIEGKLPRKVSLAQKAVYHHYQGRPCSFLGYETNPQQIGANAVIDQVKSLLKEIQK